MSTHTQALARLEGARAQHTLPPVAIDAFERILRRHGPEDCTGIRHILGRPECEAYKDALRVVGLKGNKR